MSLISGSESLLRRTASRRVRTSTPVPAERPVLDQGSVNVSDNQLLLTLSRIFTEESHQNKIQIILSFYDRVSGPVYKQIIFNYDFKSSHLQEKNSGLYLIVALKLCRVKEINNT